LGTDDYVVGDRDLRRATLEGGDPWKKYDFELLNAKVEQIARLAPGESVRVPAYDEATGVAVAAGEVGYPRTIDRVGVLVVEGDFPALVNPCLSIFLDVSDADRLANRVDRDARARNGSDPTAVIENFKLRQALQHIPITLPARQRCAWVIEAIIVDGHWCYSLATVGNYAG
jgi:uridine kinase